LSFSSLKKAWNGPKLLFKDGLSKNRFLKGNLLSKAGVCRFTLPFSRCASHSDVAIRDVKECHSPFLESASWP
jgi:hypothetical protein